MIEQITWLGLCVYHESQGETFDGQVAVAHTILNRVVQEDKSVKDVVLRPWQFSWANGNGGKKPITDPIAFINCMKAAEKCLEQRLDGFDFYGVDHYYSTDIPEPYWVQGMKKFVKQIGKHRFYKA